MPCTSIASRLLFTAVISMATGVVCGLVPAFQLSRSNPGDVAQGRRARRQRQRPAPGRGRRSWSPRWRSRSCCSTAAGLLARSLDRAAACEPRLRYRARACRCRSGCPARAIPTRMTMRAATAACSHDELVRAARRRRRRQCPPRCRVSGGDIGVGFTIEGRPAWIPATRNSAQYSRHQPRILLDDGHSAAARTGVHRRATAPAAAEVVIINDTFAANALAERRRPRQAHHHRLQQDRTRAKSSASSAA